MLYNRLDSLPLKFLAEEHKLLRELKRFSISDRDLLVAVSGGVDSVLVLIILMRLQPILKNRLHVVHIHHGFAKGSYRDRALQFVRQLAKELKIPFYTNRVRRSRKILKSEEELRDYRHQEIKKVHSKLALRTESVPILVFAHQQDDVIETQLIRLIRGTTALGLAVLPFYDAKTAILRPLVQMNKSTVLTLAKKLSLKWVEDPSNKNTDPLRNWLRQAWLPSLEKKIPGALQSLSRSLSHVSQQGQSLSQAHVHSNLDFKKGIDRKDFLTFDREKRHAVVASYIRYLNVHKYTQGQIEEICRRLDNRRGEHTFVLLGHKWRVNTQRIKADKV